MTDMLLTIKGPKYRDALLWLQERGIEAKPDRIGVAQSLKWCDQEAVVDQQIDLSGLEMTKDDKVLFKLTWCGV